MSAPWTFAGYWATVIGDGLDLEPDTRQGLDEWLGHAEVEAWRVGGLGGDLPEEWRGFHVRALAQLDKQGLVK